MHNKRMVVRGNDVTGYQSYPQSSAYAGLMIRSVHVNAFCIGCVPLYFRVDSARSFLARVFEKFTKIRWCKRECEEPVPKRVRP